MQETGWLLPVKAMPEEETAVMKREIPIMPAEWNKKVPDVLKSEITHKLIKATIVAPVTPSAEPTISLQVAVFQKKSEALKAQRRIINKLKLPVEVVQVYDIYKVIISGFFTREETYKYYPELAGLGYSEIFMIIKE